MSAVEDIRRGANQSLNLNDVSTLIKNARASTRPGTIHSCQLCNAQELDPLLCVETDDHVEPHCVVKYRGTTVLEGVSKGCDLFQELIAELEYTLQQKGYGDGSGCVLEFRPQKWICKLNFHSRLRWASIKWESVEGELPAMSLPAADWQAGRTYSFVADKDDPASKTVRARPFSYERISSQAMAWAKNLLRVCETDHTACSKPDQSFVPSRLLRLQSGSDRQILVILETDPATKWHATTGGLEYMALSYCWGGAQELQLNANSEEDLTRGIHVSSLPLTLRDAVLVAWDLGICFVWIDCLCIRQDNPNDLASEIAQIPEIYENSRITISAARASHSREGFLHPSSLPPRSKAAFRLPFACPDGNLGSVILYDAQSNLSPIDRRAWTLQEYLLSRRVVQFTNFQLHWTCRQTALFYLDEPDSLPVMYTEYVSRIHRMYCGFYNTRYTCKDWMNIVEEYTKRSLANIADKLEAISGVAKKWGALSKDSYAAGLWRSHLPLGLLWTSAQPHHHAPTTYLAPSWSWASRDSQIDYFSHLHTTVNSEFAVVSCSALPTYEQSPYGSVASGSIVIRGRLQESLLPGSSLSPLSSSGGEILDLSLASVFEDFFEDSSGCKIEDYRLYSFQVCNFNQETKAGPSGLILARDGDQFRRVGVFFFEPPDTENMRRLGLQDYRAMSSFSEEILDVQKRAFQNATPRIITVL